MTLCLIFDKHFWIFSWGSLASKPKQSSLSFRLRTSRSSEGFVCLFVYFVFLPSCYRLTSWLSLEKRKLITAELHSFLDRAVSAGGAYTTVWVVFLLCAVTLCWSWCLAKCLVFTCFSFLALPWREIVFSYMQIQIRGLLVWTKTKLMEAHDCALFIVLPNIKFHSIMRITFLISILFQQEQKKGLQGSLRLRKLLHAFLFFQKNTRVTSNSVILYRLPSLLVLWMSEG